MELGPWRLLLPNVKRTTLRLILCLSAFAAFAGPPAAAAAPQSCPTFRVLHDDRIGMLQLPKSTYNMRTSNANKISCAQASRRFTQFLEDYNGILPSPWRYRVISVGNGRFIRGRRGPSFRVSRTTGGGGGGGGGGVHPDSGRRCPGTFMVLHNDRIGRLRLPRGEYMITLLQLRDLSCRQASQNLTRFLSIPSGNLPDPWVLYPGSGAFRRGPRGPGFRIKPLP